MRMRSIGVGDHDGRAARRKRDEGDRFSIRRPVKVGCPESNGRWLFPSAFMIQIPAGARLVSNAMEAPSGDHRGLLSWKCAAVSRDLCVPSACMTKMLFPSFPCAGFCALSESDTNAMSRESNSGGVVEVLLSPHAVTTTPSASAQARRTLRFFTNWRTSMFEPR